MTKQAVQTKESAMLTTDSMYRFGYEAAEQDRMDGEFSYPIESEDGAEYTRGYFDALLAND